MLKKLKKYIDNPKFTPENVEKVSKVSGRYMIWLELVSFTLMKTRARSIRQKNSRIVGTGANGKKISLESFRKIQKVLNFRNVNHSNETSGNSGRNFEWYERRKFRNVGYTSRGCSNVPENQNSRKY